MLITSFYLFREFSSKYIHILEFWWSRLQHKSFGGWRSSVHNANPVMLPSLQPGCPPAQGTQSFPNPSVSVPPTGLQAVVLLPPLLLSLQAEGCLPWREVLFPPIYSVENESPQRLGRWSKVTQVSCCGNLAPEAVLLTRTQEPTPQTQEEELNIMVPSGVSFMLIILFIYFWLCWVFVAVRAFP